MRKSQLPDVTPDLGLEPIRTHNGQALSPKEDRFVSLYIKYADPAKAAKEAGYSVRDTVKNKDSAYLTRGRTLLAKDYIQHEIAYRNEAIRSKDIADANEVLSYLTAVMRGDIKDQFGLDTSIADRTTAAKELNRRLREMEVSTDTANKREVRLILDRG